MAGKKKKLTPKSNRRKKNDGESSRVESSMFDEEHDEGDEREIDDVCRQDSDDDDVIEENIVEETCNDLVVHFGEGFAEEENMSDGDSGDDIWDDEKIPSPLSSDDDEETYERREMLANTLDSEEYLFLGKTYGCAADFKVAVLRYSLKTGYDIKLYKSTTKRLGAKCNDVEKECGWRVYCSYVKRKHKMQIKVYINEHSCMRSGYTKMLKVSSIAMLFSERLRLNPKLTKKDMVDEIKREYNMIVTEDQCAKAKSKLYKERKAGHEAHFSRLWDYQAQVLKTNQHTTIDIETIPGATQGCKQRFNRIYICFTAQRESWIESCRPIIGLDGAFLKWDIKGQLLAAVGRDGDNRIVPIAWAVVEIENDTNWEWFVQKLKEDLNLGDGGRFTIISDKQKGLVKAVKNELPEAEHRMCARHILANWKRDNKDPEIERMFWRIAGSYTEGDYADNLKALKDYCTGAHDTLLKTNPST